MPSLSSFDDAYDGNDAYDGKKKKIKLLIFLFYIGVSCWVRLGRVTGGQLMERTLRQLVAS